VALTPNNIEVACTFCMADTEAQAIQSKRQWALRYGEAVLGYLAYEGESMVGGIEFLCASRVPFPLPDRQPTTAFITCLYSTEDAQDYRAQLLEYLLTQLSGSSYQRVQVVAGRHLAYPNGPEPIFSAQGFREVAILDRVVLNEGEDTLVLMERRL
jgi:hypothetical protein